MRSFRRQPFLFAPFSSELINFGIELENDVFDTTSFSLKKNMHFFYTLTSEEGFLKEHLFSFGESLGYENGVGLFEVLPTGKKEDVY